MTIIDVGGRDAARQFSSASGGSPDHRGRWYRRLIEHGFRAQKRRSERWSKQNQSRCTRAGWRYGNANANTGKRINQSLRPHRDRRANSPAPHRAAGGHHDASATPCSTNTAPGACSHGSDQATPPLIKTNNRVQTRHTIRSHRFADIGEFDPKETCGAIQGLMGNAAASSSPRKNL